METKAINTYHKGNLCEYTGETGIFHGGLFYEVKTLEGHLKGRCEWIRKSKVEAIEENKKYEGLNIYEYCK